jgi:DNA-binding CsgD family transcriptional regulator
MSELGFLNLQSRAESVTADAGPRPAGLAALQAMLIEELECGLLVCDASGSVVFANDAARRELALGRLLAVAGGVLRCVGSANCSFGAALRAAATAARRQLVALERGDDRLLVSLVPLRDGGENLVLVVLGRRSACSALGLEMLGSVYGLTLAERQVLAGLLADRSPRDIARDKGVELSTVRTQIASIRTKLGVRSVEALLLRVAEVPPVAPALRLCVVPGSGGLDRAACGA